MQVDGSMPESFYFRVNGIPIFMKGANVIPMSVIPSNTTTELIEATLQAAVDSNQNMLRVWGGGLYHVSLASSEGGGGGVLAAVVSAAAAHGTQQHA
jgi:beta-mannosidase